MGLPLKTNANLSAIVAPATAPLRIPIRVIPIERTVTFCFKVYLSYFLLRWLIIAIIAMLLDCV
jgi:hypothetical protein